MFLTQEGMRLHMKLDMPADSPARCPLVIVIHGFTGHMEERHILAVSQAIRDAGCAALRVDMYGHGGSDGDFTRHTLAHWLRNARAVIDYARSLDFVTELYLCGHSQGGLTAMLAGAMMREHIAGLILLSPAWMIPAQAREGVFLGVRFDPDMIPAALATWGLDGSYLRVARTIRVEEAIDRYDGPVLLVHGTEDATVDVRCGRLAASRYRSAAFVPIAGDTHCYDRHLEEVARAVTDWLRRRTAHGQQGSRC